MCPSVRPAACAAVLGLLVAASSARAQVTYTDHFTLSPPSGFTFAAPSDLHAAAGGQIVGGGSGLSEIPFTAYAVLWNAAGTGINLHPDGYEGSYASGVSGGQQVGYGHLPFTDANLPRALLWQGTNVATDLHPTSGYVASRANATDGSYQVGTGLTDPANGRALLWNGSAASVIDLHPVSGYSLSVGFGVGGANGGEQVGYGRTTGFADHALRWNSTAASVVDLHPSGFTLSNAFNTDGDQQVGYGITGGNSHALLWDDTAASAIDLDPTSTFLQSYAVGVDDGRQVGYGIVSGDIYHALFWNGSAASLIDLHAVLPASFTRSWAYSIDGDTVYGVARDSFGSSHAITWTIPEPAAMSLLACGATLVLRRRRNA